ncbi:unnamed protein product [Dicrocoelium dendriticum]|nr:unnamed protein product [Dicrocoelium dendriticum]
MFPTSGLFQEFVCPMFSAGSCDRPYCHFSHANPDSAPSDTVVSKTFPDSATPVYKPTPISLLEKRETEHSIRPTVSHPKLSNGTETTRSALPIPVYQPTPIRELEKYAPSSITVPGIDVEDKDKSFIRPSEPPTYSPVVRLKPNRIDPPPTPSYLGPFVYQPSPAYPPMTDDRVSKPFNPSIDTATAPTSDGAESEIFSPSSSSEKDDKQNLAAGTELNSQEKKLKRKQSVSQPELKSPNPPMSCDNRVIKDEPEETENADAIKRQKLLSLYKDLYGDQPLSSKAASDTSVSSKTKSLGHQQTSIAPYLGSPLPKSTQRETTTVAKDDELCPDRISEPPVALVPRPRVPLYKSDKIPMPIRTRYLDQFIEECLVIYECPNDAYERALTDEQTCHDKATSRMAYLNAVIHCLKSLKNEKLKVQSDGVKKLGPSSLRKPPGPKSDMNSQQTEQLKTEQELLEEKLSEAVQGMGVKKSKVVPSRSNSDVIAHDLIDSEVVMDSSVEATAQTKAAANTVAGPNLSRSQRKRLKKVLTKKARKEQRAKQPQEEEQEPPLSPAIVLPKRACFVSQLDTEEKRFSAAMSRLAETHQHVLKIQPVPHICPTGLLRDLCPLAVNVRLPTTSRAGYAFLQFRNQHELEVAQKQLVSKSLNGKPLKVEPATTTRNERKPSDFEWTTLFVTRLPRATTRIELGQLFRKAHRIRLISYDDGSCKGSCFLFYKSPQDALRAFESRHGTFIHGVPIYVNFALKQPNKPNASSILTPDDLDGATERTSVKRSAPMVDVLEDGITAEPPVKQARVVESTKETEFLIDRAPGKKRETPTSNLSKKSNSEATNRRADQPHPKLLSKHQLKRKVLIPLATCIYKLL